MFFVTSKSISNVTVWIVIQIILVPADDGGTDVDSDGSDDLCKTSKKIILERRRRKYCLVQKISKLHGMLGKFKKSFLSNEVGDTEEEW